MDNYTYFTLISGAVTAVLMLFSFKMYAELIRLRAQKSQLEDQLSELRHRTKNHLQLASSVLNLQRADTKNPAAQHALSAACNRMETLNYLYEQLSYREGDEPTPIKDYLVNLMHHFDQLGGLTVKATLDTTNTPIAGDKMISLSLIINELATNTIKYGSTPTYQPDFNLSFREFDSHYELNVSNNGPALPSDFATAKESLGFRLIRSLSNRLNARLEIQSAPHPVFHFVIPKAVGTSAIFIPSVRFERQKKHFASSLHFMTGND